MERPRLPDHPGRSARACRRFRRGDRGRGQGDRLAGTRAIRGSRLAVRCRHLTGSGKARADRLGSAGGGFDFGSAIATGRGSRRADRGRHLPRRNCFSASSPRFSDVQRMSFTSRHTGEDLTRGGTHARIIRGRAPVGAVPAKTTACCRAPFAWRIVALRIIMSNRQASHQPATPPWLWLLLLGGLV